MFCAYVIHSNCARLFFMMDYGENGLFTLKNVSKHDQKLIIRRRRGRGGWNKDVLGGKKSKN